MPVANGAGIHKDVLVWSAADLDVEPTVVGSTFRVVGSPDLMSFKDDEADTVPSDFVPADPNSVDPNQTLFGTLDGVEFTGNNGTGDVFEFEVAFQVTDGVNTFNVYQIDNNHDEGDTGGTIAYVSEVVLDPNATYTVLAIDASVNSADGGYETTPTWSDLAGQVDGTSGDDVIGAGFTDDDADAVDGADGVNDVIVGEGGGDTISAGAGNDLVYGDHVDDIPPGRTEYILQGFVRDLNFELEAGSLRTDTSDLSISGTPIEIRIIDNDSGIGDDDAINDAATDTDQLIEINGVLYSFAPDFTQVFAGSDGNNYTMMVIDVDRNFSGAFDNYNSTTDAGDVDYEHGQILIPVGTPPPAGVSLTATGSSTTVSNPDYSTLGGVAVTNYNDSIDAGDGDDTVFAGQGDDTVLGGLGNDVLNAGGGADSVSGGDGDDTIVGDAEVGSRATNIGHDFSNNWSGSNSTLDGNRAAFTADGVWGSAQREITSGMSSGPGASGGALVTLDFAWSDGVPAGSSGFSTFWIEYDGVGYVEITTPNGDGTNAIITYHNGANGVSRPLSEGDVVGGTGYNTITFELPAGIADNGTLTFRADSTTGQDDFAIDNVIVETNVPVAAAGNDTIDGGAGSDFIDGGGGDDLLDGGTGNDTVIGGTGTDTISGGSGDDLLFGDADVLPTDNLLSNGDFTDGLTDWVILNPTGGFSPHVDGTDIHLNGDEETVYGDGIEQTVSTLAGESYDLTVGLQEFGAGTGDHTVLIEALDSFGAVIASQTLVVLDGQSVSPTLTFTAADAETTIRITNPTSTNSIATDLTITDVTLIGPSGDGTGNDVIDGGDGSDTIYGGAGDDTIDGGTGNDTIDGGKGSDTFVLSDGFNADTIAGDEDAGNGDVDVLDASGVTAAGVLLNTTNEAGSLTQGPNTATFSGMESFVLTSQDDIANIWASSNAIVDAGAGNDTIKGGTGDDTLIGGDGNDLFRFENNFGNDTVQGGNVGDTDTIDFSAITGTGINVTFSASEDGTATDGTDTVTFDDIEAVIGSNQADLIDATADSSGLALDGGGGDDTITGGAGDDTITGGTGDDILTGGGGNDVYTYSFGDGNDTIADFNFGNTGTLSDGDSTNNDFINLSAFYDNIWELHDDYADDNILNQSNTGNIIRGSAVDYSDNTSFGAGSLTFTGASADNTSFTSENTGVVCFVSGTLISTVRGEVPVEDLKPLDLVRTMDNGFQPIRWIGSRDVGPTELANHSKLRPIRISKAAFGLPDMERDLIVSPQHRILIRSEVARRMFGSTEILVPAKKLLGMDGVDVVDDCRAVTYYHVLLDTHQILFANGAPAESLYLGKQALSNLSPQSRIEINTLFQRLTQKNFDFPSCRPLVAGKRVRKLAERLSNNKKLLLSSTKNRVALTTSDCRLHDLKVAGADANTVHQLAALGLSVQAHRSCGMAVRPVLSW